MRRRLRRRNEGGGRRSEFSVPSTETPEHTVFVPLASLTHTNLHRQPRRPQYGCGRTMFRSPPARRPTAVTGVSVAHHVTVADRRGVACVSVLGRRGCCATCPPVSYGRPYG